MLKELVKIANKLDFLGLTKEADIIDSEILKLASDDIFEKLAEAVDYLLSLEGEDADYKRYVYVNHNYSIDEREEVSEQIISYIKVGSKFNQIPDNDLKEKVRSLKRTLNSERNKIPPSTIEGSRLNSYDERWERERISIESEAPETSSDEQSMPSESETQGVPESEVKSERPEEEEESLEGLSVRQKEQRLMRKFLQFLYERNRGDRKNYIKNLSHENALKFLDFFIQKKDEMEKVFDAEMLFELVKKIDPRNYNDFTRDIRTFLEQDREGRKPGLLFNKYPEALMRFWKALSPEMKEMLRYPTSGGSVSVFKERFDEPISYIERDKSDLKSVINMGGKAYKPSPMSEEEKEIFRVENEERLKEFFERLRQRELKKTKDVSKTEDLINVIGDLDKPENREKYYVFKINFRTTPSGKIKYRKPFYQIVDTEGKSREEARAEAVRLSEEFDKSHPKFIEEFPDLDPFKYIKGKDACQLTRTGDIPHVVSTSNINVMNTSEFDRAFGEEIIPEQDIGLPEGTFETTEEDMERVLYEDDNP